MTDLIEKLIDAVVGNCDTANLDREAARTDIIAALKTGQGQSHRFEEEEGDTEGVLLNVTGYEVRNGKTPLNGAPVPPEFQMIFGSFGKVTGVIVWPHNGGIIDVVYEDGLELGFIPAFPADNSAPVGKPH